MTFFDEAGHIRDRKVFLTAFPVATQRRNICFMPTTPGPETYYFRYLIEQVDENNDPRMFIIRFGTVCDACRISARPWLCRHMDDSPNWISRTKQDALAYLYGGDERFRAQELLALPLSEVNHMFAPFVPLLSQAPRFVEHRTPVSPLFCFVDVAVGGGNETAATMIHVPDWDQTDPRKIVIVYQDTFDVGGAADDEADAMPARAGAHLREGGPIAYRTMRLRRMITLVRSFHMFANVPIVFGIEDRPVGIGNQIRNDLLGEANVTHMMESGTDGKRRYGLPIDNDGKGEMSRRFQQMISRPGLVSYSDHLMTYDRDERDVEATRLLFERQLSNWYEKQLTTAEPNRPATYVYGGKGGNGQNDDGAMVTVMAGFWPFVYMQRMKRRLS